MKQDPFIPKGALTLVFLLVGLSALAATVGVLTAAPKEGIPENIMADARSTVLHFADRQDGAIVVTTDEGETVLEPGTSGFIRGVLRGLAYKRRGEGVGPEAPFVLAVDPTSGALTLNDPSTQSRVFLRAFGEDNAAAFAALIPSRDGPASPVRTERE
ncbi:MAG: photosynthetic complex assembly protein PuhC [Pseudomonadota bacterium]